MAKNVCPHCSGALPGLYLPEGSTVDDLAVVYRFVGLTDLGSASKGDRGLPDQGRGCGGETRAKANTGRAGRSQAKARREEEHA